MLILVLAQIYLGALVAGLRAGYIYNTWPLIDGALVPDAARLFLDTPVWRNFFENTLTVQFDHRMLAYAIFICALLHAFDVARTVKQGWMVTSASVLAIAVTLQAALGIWTLLMARADLARSDASGDGDAGADRGDDPRRACRRPPRGRPRKHPAGAGLIADQSASACSRSAMMSSLSSMPIDSRTTSGPAPACTFCASLSWRCVVEAG